MSTQRDVILSKQDEWVVEPARRFVRYFAETSYILTLSIQGIEEQSKQVKIIENPHLKSFFESVIKEYKETVELQAWEQLQTSIDLYNRISFFASNEAEKKFPIIHSHTLVAFWGALEVFVDDLILAWLSHKPEVLKCEGLSKLKITLAEFEALNQEERLMLLLEEIKTQSKSNTAKGKNQFENMLKVIGLGGPVDKKISDTLFTTQQIRNLVVHRGSVADKRFVDACPKFCLKVGDRFLLSESIYLLCRDCIEDYVLCLTSRFVSHMGYEDIDSESLWEIIVRPILDATKPPIEVSLI